MSDIIEILKTLTLLGSFLAMLCQIRYTWKIFKKDATVEETVTNGNKAFKATSIAFFLMSINLLISQENALSLLIFFLAVVMCQLKIKQKE